jgi:hypothetical protein
MNKRLQEARELLEKAEKTVDPSAKKTLCESAIEIFEEVKEDDPSEKNLQMITNLRKAFTRSQLEKMEEMSMKNIQTTEFFFFNYIFRFPQEIHDLMDEKPEYRKKFKWLMEQFGQDIDHSR